MEWISVKDSLPPIGKVVLVYHENDKYGPFFVVAAFLHGGQISWVLKNFISMDDNLSLGPFSPTHWMPLPEPPEV